MHVKSGEFDFIRFALHIITFLTVLSHMFQYLPECRVHYCRKFLKLNTMYYRNGQFLRTVSTLLMCPNIIGGL